MGGNDHHDKYGRPYELDDSKEIIYDRLEAFREATNSFIKYLEEELQELSTQCTNGEFGQATEILDNFHKYFSGCDY